ncbi:MAG: hypothetical protein A2Z20_06860 [Bdellovibrionales bacterium RBG_16_40_8]|nr:MAG: hypothetical protein A2Z20_06860 [Bdellovibrionales bacterium RBG_16_40_8]
MKQNMFMKGVSNNLLIFESGLQLSREYWLKDFIDLGYNLFLAQPWPITWEHPYITKYLKIQFNPWTPEEQTKLLKFISENKIHGIICLNEGTVPFASDIIEALGLPRFSGENIRNLRNKKLMRQKLFNSGILQPQFIYVDDITTFERNTIKYPAVVKPAEMMASLGVKLVNSDDELAKAITAAQNVDFNGENLRNHYGFDKGVLIESYLKGKELSIETFVQNGKVIDFFITQKFKCAEPYFDEIGHLANPQISNSQFVAIREFINLLHKNLSILNAITHTEVKIDGDQVGLIEIGCRPGGDLIPLIHKYSASVSFAEVAAKINMGIQVDHNWLPIEQRKEVAVFFPHDGAAFTTTRSELEAQLVDTQIYQFIFNKNKEPINDGLATSRKGQVVFSHFHSTEDILNKLVFMSGGI